MKQRTLALAGVFQATELVRQAANHGTWSGYAANTCLDSLFAVESETVEGVYGDNSHMRLGIETLIAVLRGENQQLDSLRYAVGLLQIERKFRKKKAMQEKVGDSIVALVNLHEELELHEKQDLQAQAIASLYSETISSLSPRIVVNGKPQYLNSERTVNWIRTLLFSGLRSAVLWKQLGGGRWSLMFGRKEILKEAETLLRS
ncbi:MAG: high frequency lysogenization protein [Lysobacterales bacterium]|jgi:high frequency lysogenization protein